MASSSKRRGGASSKKAEFVPNADSEEDLELVAVLARRAQKRAEQAKNQLDEECHNIQQQLMQNGRDFVVRHTNEVGQIMRRHNQRMEELHEEKHELLRKFNSESDKLMDAWKTSFEIITKNRHTQEKLLQEFLKELEHSFSDIMKQMRFDSPSSRQPLSLLNRAEDVAQPQELNQTNNGKRNQPVATNRTPEARDFIIPPVLNTNDNRKLNAREKRGVDGAENEENDGEEDDQGGKGRQAKKHRKSDFHDYFSADT